MQYTAFCVFTLYYIEEISTRLKKKMACKGECRTRYIDASQWPRQRYFVRRRRKSKKNYEEQEICSTTYDCGRRFTTRDFWARGSISGEVIYYTTRLRCKLLPKKLRRKRTITLCLGYL